jgi:integrase
MASLRIRKNKIYILYYDSTDGKGKSKSTGLDNLPKNLKIARQVAKQLQDKLDENKKKKGRLRIEKKTLRDAFDHFIENNQYKNPKTIWEYNWFFREFIKDFNEDMPCTRINKLNIEKWLNKIKRLDFRKNTIHTLGKQCRHFLNFLFEYDYCPIFKINREVMTKPEVGPKIVFEKGDIITLFEEIEKVNSGLKLLVYMAFYTGLRPSDLYNVQIEDIDLTERSLKYYSLKRAKYRHIAIHEDLVSIIKSYIEDRNAGRLLQWSQYNYLGKAITRLFKDMEFDKKGYSARTFRKTFITLARSEYNMDASVVRQLVGHEHQNTTDRYYNEISLETMKKELIKFKRPVK